MMLFEVYRHGGRRTDQWRLMVSTDNSQLAHEVYEDTARKMRQGGVEKRVDGTVACSQWAPRLRSRW